MVRFMAFLCVLCILPVCSNLEETCPRKDPPPGVLVVSPGSSLVLTCGGDVKVNGAAVNGAAVNGAAVIPTSSGNNRKGGPTSISWTTAGGSDWEDREKKDDHEDEEGSKVILRHQWKRSKLPAQKGDENWGKVSVISQEEVLSLGSVTTTDTGRYACYRRGEKQFAVKVFVADPPETPSLSCYKKSPISKIICEWRPQKPVIKPPSCHLVLKKRTTVKQIPCSYSSEHSLCWCTLEHNDDEQRTPHIIFLCVTSILGNATSPPLFFRPLRIVKPDPPSDVSVHQQEGQEREIKVTWNFPASWKQADNYYILLYQIRYRPVASAYVQVNEILNKRSYTITDALPGEEYLIQLRARDEYDGQWSEWSPPVYTRCWTAEVVPPFNWIDSLTDLPTLEDLGSGSLDNKSHEGPENDTDPRKLLQYMIWTSGLVAFFSILLAIYIFRHKDNYFSKLYKRLAFTWCGDLSPPSPSAPEAPKGETLVTFVPQLDKERPPSDVQEEEENEEEQSVTDRVQTVNFNNTSYFFLQAEM